MTGSIFLEASEYSVSETNGSITVAVVRTGDLSGPVTIEYGTNPDSATAGIDYKSSNGFVTMAAGQNRIIIKVPVIDDKLAESTETFNLSLINVSSGTLLFPRTARIDILDDEKPAAELTEPPLISNYDVKFEPVVKNLGTPISIEFSPLDPTIAYVALKTGVVKAVNLATGQQIATVLDISPSVNSRGDRGVMDIALHPNFKSSPYIYVSYVVDPPDIAGQTGNAGADGGGNRFLFVSRFTIDSIGGYLKIVPGSEVVIAGGGGDSLADISGGGALDFTQVIHSDKTSSAIDSATGTFKKDFIKVDSLSHAGGALTFGPDGALYITTGDGTSFNYADPRSVEVQNVNSLSGKVLRVDALTGLGLADNPFVKAGSDLSQNSAKVYQLGLRNPFAAVFDEKGRLFLSETGWFTYEEINTGSSAANFGWPFFEGADNGVLSKTSVYSQFLQATEFYESVAKGLIKVTAPFRAFSHSTNAPGHQVQAIVGASDIYTGSAYPEVFKNDYFFTDVSQGEIYSVDVNDQRKIQYLTTLPTGFGPVHFAQGPDGFMYYADLVTGAIGRIKIGAISGFQYDISAASQTLRGTSNIDTFVINEQSGHFTFAPSSDGAGVVVSRGANPDLLYGFERIQFSDKTVNVAALGGVRIDGTPKGDIVNGQISVSGQRKPTPFADTIRGNAGDDSVSGLDGNDAIWGGAGRDTIHGGDGNDKIWGDGGSLGATAQTKTMAKESATANNDTLYGGNGDDYLDGGAGGDKLYGGAGNDTYIAGKGDTLTEGTNAGVDTVRTASTFALGANFENLILTGRVAIKGGGNNADNFINGATNSAANILSGKGGDDLYEVGKKDKIIESSTGGLGTVQTSGVNIDLTSSAFKNVENITLLGASSLSGKGSAGANTIIGNGGANSLDGRAGNDILYGGAGNDTLIGGAGLDSFVFNSALTAANVDRLADYVVADDSIWLENAIFSSLTSTGVLNATFFRVGTTAADSNDHIIYNPNTGALIYDDNGNASGGATQFATLTTRPATLSAADFIVM